MSSVGPSNYWIILSWTPAATIHCEKKLRFPSIFWVKHVMPIGVINFIVIGVRNYFDDGGLNNNHYVFLL